MWEVALGGVIAFIGGVLTVVVNAVVADSVRRKREKRECIKAIMAWADQGRQRGFQHAKLKDADLLALTEPPELLVRYILLFQSSREWLLQPVTLNVISQMPR